MHKTIVIATAALLCAGTARAQTEIPKAVQPKRIVQPTAPGEPQPGRPDTTLLDDTEASGLQPRVKRLAVRQAASLPLGMRCRIETVQGKTAVGTLEAVGDWLVVRRDGNAGKIWLAAQHVVAIAELTAEDGEEATTLEPRESPLLKELRARVATLQAELEAMTKKLAEARAEAAQAIREAVK